MSQMRVLKKKKKKILWTALMFAALLHCPKAMETSVVLQCLLLLHHLHHLHHSMVLNKAKCLLVQLLSPHLSQDIP